ncbi:hypothetical protein NPIL_384091 [Nephila pilipes]|uniref:Uncharacterized protein n=1 Tax=Nephila pilipes TaxID=299642 RepID=A0A8X6TP67_NEPPI|nr:hypothetical protein NPIL_384091 [Nephila pilipes]
MKGNSKSLKLTEMLAKKNSGYRQVPLADIGSPIQIVLSTPDDSECEGDDTIETVSDITVDIENTLSCEVSECILLVQTHYVFYKNKIAQE